MGNDYRIFDRRESQARVSLPLARSLQEGAIVLQSLDPKKCMHAAPGRSVESSASRGQRSLPSSVLSPSRCSHQWLAK